MCCLCERTVGGFKSLYFAKLKSFSHKLCGQFDCDVVYNCEPHVSVLLQNPHTVLIHVLLETNSVLNNLYQTIFQEYHRIGHWITRDIYTNKEKKILGKNVFVDVCLPACLFIHLFIYYLEVAL